MRIFLTTILSFLFLTSPLFGQSEETCYVVVGSSEGFNSTLLSNISISIISQFLREVEPIPPEGVSKDSCLYQISVSKEKDTTFVTFKGKNLNSYGDSKLSGTDGFQQSLLKSLYRSLEDKRKKICEDYGELLEKCGSVVVQDVPKVVKKNVGSNVCESVCEGLVGYYPFNGNAKDFSGNGNHGDVYDAKLTSDSKGNAKSAYLFNGKDSYIVLPNTVKGSSFTLSAYVKVNKFIEVTKKECPKGGGSRAGIITHGGSGLQLMNCSGWYGENQRFPDGFYKLWYQVISLCNTGNCVMEDNQFSKMNKITIGNYYLLTITKDKTGILSLYKNNKLLDKRKWIFDVKGNFIVGIHDETTLWRPGALDGIIDEIRIYNRALKRSEVNDIYESFD